MPFVVIKIKFRVEKNVRAMRRKVSCKLEHNNFTNLNFMATTSQIIKATASNSNVK